MPIDAIGHVPGAGATPAAATVAQPRPPAREDLLRQVAIDFEAMFLAQMLDHAGLGKTPEAFGGGAGEEAFRGHMIEQQARLMAERGGIGLAETIFRAMLAREEVGR